MENEEQLLKNFLLDIDCLDELTPWIENFNLFEVLGIEKAEIRHSNVLAWLLNPNENHGLKDKFLQALIQELIKNDVYEKLDSVKLLALDLFSFLVYREKNHIDILLKSKKEKIVIVIENKIESSEHGDQLQRYKDIIFDDSKDYTKIFIYLTPDGDDSSDTENWKSLSYKSILDILTKLYDENIKELAEEKQVFIHNYIKILRRKIVTDDALIEICNKIYSKHKKAFDLIYNNIDDPSDLDFQEVKTVLTNYASKGSIIYDAKGRCFYSAELDKILADNTSDSNRVNRCYKYFAIKKNGKFSFLLQIQGENKELFSKNVQDNIEKLLKKYKNKSFLNVVKYLNFFSTSSKSFEEGKLTQEFVEQKLNELLEKQEEFIDFIKKG